MTDELHPADIPRVLSERQIMLAARRIAGPDYNNLPNWYLASEVFSLGSTYSYRLCARAGIDPDATRIERTNDVVA